MSVQNFIAQAKRRLEAAASILFSLIFILLALNGLKYFILGTVLLIKGHL